MGKYKNIKDHSIYIDGVERKPGKLFKIKETKEVKTAVRHKYLEAVEEVKEEVKK